MGIVDLLDLFQHSYTALSLSSNSQTHHETLLQPPSRRYPMQTSDIVSSRVHHFVFSRTKQVFRISDINSMFQNIFGVNRAEEVRSLFLRDFYNCFLKNISWFNTHTHIHTYIYTRVQKHINSPKDTQHIHTTASYNNI